MKLGMIYETYPNPLAQLINNIEKDCFWLNIQTICLFLTLVKSYTRLFHWRKIILIDVGLLISELVEIFTGNRES